MLHALSRGRIPVCLLGETIRRSTRITTPSRNRRNAGLSATVQGLSSRRRARFERVTGKTSTTRIATRPTTEERTSRLRPSPRTGASREKEKSSGSTPPFAYFGGKGARSSHDSSVHGTLRRVGQTASPPPQSEQKRRFLTVFYVFYKPLKKNVKRKSLIPNGKFGYFTFLRFYGRTLPLVTVYVYTVHTTTFYIC